MEKKETLKSLWFTHILSYFNLVSVPTFLFAYNHTLYLPLKGCSLLYGIKNTYFLYSILQERRIKLGKESKVLRG